jgi:hypothetical protein
MSILVIAEASNGKMVEYGKCVWDGGKSNSALTGRRVEM